MAAQSIILKVLSFGSQLVLAWLLAPRDFGIAGLGLTLAAFADLLQRSGVRDVILARPKRIHFWLSGALLMNCAVGLAGGCLLACAAPWAAARFHNPELLPILLVLAASIPLNAAVTVLQAGLEARLRFGMIAGTGFAVALMQALMSVALATLGWGALALIAPIPFGHVLRLMVYGRAVQPSMSRVGIRRWPHLLNDSVVSLLGYACAALIWQGDYLILGYFQGAEQLGYYYFAFNLSLQFVLLLTGNLGSALFPALASLAQLPDRQLDAYLSATRVIAYFGVPLCLCQAALARPLYALLFAPKWANAIVLTQILCLGMSVRIVEWTSESLLKAQGRFRTFMWLTAAHGACFVALVPVTAQRGGARAVAIAVASLLVVFGPIRMAVTLRSVGGVRMVAQVLAVPLAGAATAAAVALAAVHWLPTSNRSQAMAALVLGVAAFGTVYGYVTRRSCPPEVSRLACRLLARGGRDAHEQLE
ncbi:MAG TPA: oligosaccharide flippase family protein [Anaeromyxobacteraceae bacterium]|jgi:PST family polysaccharide transporter|nr:oligosaccharide flippase family protein [Anaeromyxobacteraceae bacterium]